MRQSLMILAAAILIAAVACAAWAGCKSDYTDAIQSCRFIYDGPDDADSLAICIRTAKDDYDSCIS